MLDLSNLAPESTIPDYKLKVKDGNERTYDTMVLGFHLRIVEGIEDPEKIRAAVKKVFDLEDVEISTFESCLILNDFRDFAKEHADAPLKKVFGRSLFLDTTTESVVKT